MMQRHRAGPLSGPQWVRYQCGVRYDWWLYLIASLAVIPFWIMGVLMLLGVIPADSSAEGVVGGTVLLGTGIFDLALFWAIFPRRLLVLQDGVKVKLGGPFSLNIPFSDVKAVERYDRWYHVGLGFAPSFKGRVLVRRKHGYDVVVSAVERDTFLEQVQSAMADWSGSRQ